MKRSLSLSALLLSLLLPACVTTDADTESAPEPAEGPLFEPSLPWTTAFVDSAILVAEEIHVSGPSGLLRHFAARVEEEYHARDEETIPEGYRQIITVRPDGPMVEVRGYLDHLELAATARLTVLERPGDVDVVIEASGDVLYSCSAQERTERRSSIRLVGRRPGK